MTRQVWYPAARRRPVPGYAKTGIFLVDRVVDDWKVIWHRTQGNGDPFSTYKKTGGIPHFTVHQSGSVDQHFPTHWWSRAMRNLPGGTEPNRDQVIQIELVGYTGRTMTRPQRQAAVALKAWVELTTGMPSTWLNGRPGSRPKLSIDAFNNGTGNMGHIDEHEQNHTDPGFTNVDWAALGDDNMAKGDPVGHHDEIIDGHIVKGWAYDPDRPGAAVGIHVWEFDKKNKPLGLVVAGTTGVHRGDVPKGLKKPDVGSHQGYEIHVPLEGKHRIGIATINVPGTRGGNDFFHGPIDVIFPKLPKTPAKPATSTGQAKKIAEGKALTTKLAGVFKDLAA